MTQDPHERLAEYALGTLEPAAAAQVEALLARSEAARRELRELRVGLVELTEGLDPVPPPAGVWERVQGGLDADAQPPVPPPTVTLPRRARLSWALAACLALVAVGELIWIGAALPDLRRAQREAQLVTAFLSEPGVERLALPGRERELLGSVLTRADGRALFVLGAAPGSAQSYQAWGHESDDWTPGGADRLTSLGVSDAQVFEVDTQDFVALYLSLEPRGGSAQPSEALSHVSLREPVPRAQLSVTTPRDGAVLRRERVIVRGIIDATVTGLSYSVNGREQTTQTVGNRFTFTAALEPGENTLTLRAEGTAGVATETLTLFYEP